MADYTAADLRAALAQVGLKRGDTLYCHSNVGLFGIPEGIADRDGLCRLFFDAIFEAIGPEGTLLVPTYTYSFSNGRDFDVAGSPSKMMGLFAEWVRQHPGAVRAPDPFYSVAAIGRDPGRFSPDLPPNSFAPGSIFDRFFAEDGKILCLNHPGCTLLHYVERQLRVPYRFDKSFTGKMTDADGATSTLPWAIWVRYLSDDLLAHDPQPFVAEIKRRGVAKWTRLGRGEVLAIGAHDVMSVVRDELSRRPWFLTAADAAGREPVLDVSKR